jgi:hypothetical protein
MYPLCFFSQYQMARTKKTAQILRSLNMSASSSSSSDEDAGDIDTTQSVIPESMDVAFDDAGVPNAQDTVAEPTQREDEDVARGGVLRLTADSDAGHAEATPYGDECSGTAGDTSDGSDDDDARREHTSPASRANRKRVISDCDDELYYVAALKKYHNSWESFEKYLKRYQRDTLTVVVIAETENVLLRNRRIAQMKVHAGKPASELPLLPEELDPYQCVYICTHGWKHRVRSKGSRPLHHTYGNGCPMRFRAQYVQQSSGQWQIEIKKAFYGHNHPVSEEIYQRYPTVRKIPEAAPIMSDVELMVASGSTASRIYDYIRERSPHYVQLNNVHNLIAKIKSSGKLKRGKPYFKRAGMANTDCFA